MQPHTILNRFSSLLLAAGLMLQLQPAQGQDVVTRAPSTNGASSLQQDSRATAVAMEISRDYTVDKSLGFEIRVSKKQPVDLESIRKIVLQTPLQVRSNIVCICFMDDSTFDRFQSQFNPGNGGFGDRTLASTFGSLIVVRCGVQTDIAHVLTHELVHVQVSLIMEESLARLIKEWPVDTARKELGDSLVKLVSDIQSKIKQMDALQQDLTNSAFSVEFRQKKAVELKELQEAYNRQVYRYKTNLKQMSPDGKMYGYDDPLEDLVQTIVSAHLHPDTFAQFGRVNPVWFQKMDLCVEHGLISASHAQKIRALAGFVK